MIPAAAGPASWGASPIGLVIFDCDGVLIDSEAVASRIVARELTAIGWTMDAQTARGLFMGMTLTDMEPVIAARIGHGVDPAWRARLSRRIVDAMGREAVVVDGAVAAIDAVEALGLPWRVASNSSHQELAAKFARTGLSARVAGKVHSHRDVARGKPAPDLFLAAAAAAGINPAGCLVIEDSAPGATAARAAGMRCLGYAPHDDGAALARQGAIVFRSMRALPNLIAGALKVTA